MPKGKTDKEEYKEEVELQKEIEESIVKKCVYLVIVTRPQNPNDKEEIVKAFDSEEKANEFTSSQSPIDYNLSVRPVEIE